MKEASLFWDTVNTLSKAFHEGIITKGCCSCDVLGVLVAKACRVGYRYLPDQAHYVPKRYRIRLPNMALVPIDAWTDLFRTTDATQLVCKNMPLIEGIPQDECLFLGKEQQKNAVALLHKTGRSVQDLRRLEYAFESTTKIDNMLYGVTHQSLIDEDIRAGIIATFGVLFDLHEVTDFDVQSRATWSLYQSNNQRWMPAA